ncbi:hypothetical protein Cyast_2548 [Cyanobacterium stanieri PCC 7202]|uniref:Uncharacterized protein n=1 Tax=Cyanobacterium stanieri (strain ATCC 29140 / PCC 7202) TaxID=292563 RepID=K9YNH2_CYASC|nr:hypothetical protein Cyast_2548 [Cyanobacterium stanieri PCC 7202]
MDNSLFVEPNLTIITPTREGFSSHWLDALIKVEGNIEFILVHPPNMKKIEIHDYRFQQINAPFRGEIIQRMTGLLNARAKYTLSINCDEYLHPEILEIVEQYFQRFPNSWVLRLATQSYAYGKKNELSISWTFSPPSIPELPIWDGQLETKNDSWNNCYLREMPIAPLKNKLNLTTFWKERKDHHGRHTENFDKKVWKTDLVKQSLLKINQNMILLKVFKYLPFWCMDRLLGLGVQANFFTKNNEIIGHILPSPEQLRSEDNPPEYRSKVRYYVLAELILLKTFPQYPYMWNLVISNTRKYGFLYLKEILNNIFKRKNNSGINS